MLIDAQGQLMLSDQAIAGLLRATGLPLDYLFLAGYGLTLTLIWIGIVLIGGRLYRYRWATLALGLTFTLRHRIARTSANSLEPYFHPRMLAFGICLLAVAAVLRRRSWLAIGLVAVSALVHVTTALWFAVMLGVAIVILDRRLRVAGGMIAAAGLLGGGAAIAAGGLGDRLVQMDGPWLEAVASKDSLFATQWPLWTWVVNFGLLAMLLAAHQRRTRRVTDPLHEGALVTPREISEMWRVIPPTKPVADQFQKAPDTATIVPFYDWLTSTPGSVPFGGGSDAIASFNHPGYFGNFESFVYHQAAAKQIFLMEAFNSVTYVQDEKHGHNATDYFWYGRDRGLPQPFNACFNAGWRVGFTGVSDEHSGHYGQTGKGRGGLYVDQVTRHGVRRAIMSRRSFGTREAGLRLDATADHVPMGSELARTSGRPVTIRLDIDRGAGWVGKKMYVQVVGPGREHPKLLDVVPFRVPSADEPLVTFDVKPHGDWMFLRITDPARPCDPLGEAPFEDATYGGACAYASPWFFTGGRA